MRYIVHSYIEAIRMKWIIWKYTKDSYYKFAIGTGFVEPRHIVMLWQGIRFISFCLITYTVRNPFFFWVPFAFDVHLCQDSKFRIRFLCILPHHLQCQMVIVELYQWFLWLKRLSILKIWLLLMISKCPVNCMYIIPDTQYAT